MDCVHCDDSSGQFEVLLRENMAELICGWFEYRCKGEYSFFVIIHLDELRLKRLRFCDLILAVCNILQLEYLGKLRERLWITPSWNISGV